MADGGDVIVRAGTFAESDIAVEKDITITGAGKTSTFVVPAVADTGGTALFSSGNAFILGTSGITVQNLTIDGAGGASPLDNGRHFRGGVVVNPADGDSPINNLTVTNVLIKNTTTVGIYLDGGIGSESTGHSITANMIDDIGGKGAPTGVLLLQAGGTVDNNTIDNVNVGIGTNYIDGVSFAPAVTITNNDIGTVSPGSVDVGMNLSGLDDGSLIGGVGNGNTINTTGARGGTDNRGAVIQYAAGNVTFSYNDIDADGRDTAVVLFKNVDSSKPVLVDNNTITAQDSMATNVGDGSGVFSTDDGTIFSDTNVPFSSYATVSNNTIVDFVNGVLVDGVTATPGGVTIDGNTINSIASTGVNVNGGVALVQNNDLNDNTFGLLIQFDGVVDAGQSGVGSNFTGLGISAGNNDFSGYTSSSATGGAIVNLNNDGGLVGPQGAPPDIAAKGNTFFSTDPAQIELAVFHDGDDNDLGFVRFAGLTIIAVNAPTTDEAQSVLLSGSFANDPHAHKVTIEWGDSTPNTVVNLPSGTFSFNAPHTYADDGTTPGGSASFNYPVNVTVEEDIVNGDSTGATTTVTVNNVAPQLQGVSLTPAIFENGTATLSGTIVDPGTLDTFTLDIDWGDPLSPNDTQQVTFPASAIGSQSFSITHQYLDDNPSSTTSDPYSVSLTVTDDDTDTGTDTQSVTVVNLAPQLSGVSLTPSIDENGTATLAGTISDPGTLDTFTLDIDWGDPLLPNNTQQVAFGPSATGSQTFSITHQYLDDNPNGTVSDTHSVQFTVTDDDGASDSDSETLTVNNVAPVATIDGAPTTSPEGTQIDLSANVVEPGTLDVLTYDWEVLKGGSPFTASSGSGPAFSTFSFTPDDGDAPGGTDYTVTLKVDDDDLGSSTDAVTFTVTNVAPTITLIGAATHDEGSTAYQVTLGAVNDPGLDTITQYAVFWGDNQADTYTTAGIKTHTYDDDALFMAGEISVTLVDEDGLHQDAGVLPLTVNNVAPTGLALNPGLVNEGSSGLVVIAGQFDPSAADTLAGFLYDYDFNNNNVIEVALGEIADTASASATVPGSFLDDDPSKTIHVVIKDKDGGTGDLFTTIPIINVAPTVDAGPDALVSTNNPAFEGVPFVRGGAFTDPGNDNWSAQVNYDVFGAGSFQPLPLTGKAFTLNHTYSNTGTFTARVMVDDGDGGVSSDDVLVEVVQNTFRVSDFVPTASGFEVTFNRDPALLPLNLYDSIFFDANLNPSDIEVFLNGTDPIFGSMDYDAATRKLTWVKTSVLDTGTGDPVRASGVLDPGAYTVRLRSAPDAFQDTLGSLLDGDSGFGATSPDFTPGDDLNTTFTVSSTTNVVFMPDIARGAGQPVNVPPESLGAGLPVSITDGTGVTTVDVDIHFDPTLLDIPIGGAAPHSGLPNDWGITQNLVTVSPNLKVLKLTASGTTPLTAGVWDIYALTASVPSIAAYGESQVITLQNARINETLPALGDAAIHKAAFLGDVGLFAGSLSTFDAALLSRVVVDLDTGFDEHRWTDPLILGDTTGNGTLSGQDASFISQKVVLLLRPEIPDVPGFPTVFAAGGVDPQVSVPSLIPASAGGTVTVPVNIDVAPGATVIAATVDVYFDDTLLDVTPGDIAGGADWSAANGWKLVSNVVGGQIIMSMFNATPSASGLNHVADLTFTVDPDASGGITPLNVAPRTEPHDLIWTDVDGSILIDDDLSPTVTKVLVGSTIWDQTFSDHLADIGLGNDLGYAIPTSGDQLDTLTWTDLDQVSLVFSEDVNVQQSDLQLAGVNVTSYDLSGGFNYDSASRTATWTLASGIGPDKLLIALDDTVTDLQGNALDGEWVDGSGAASSGDGAAGGDFLFRLNVLPGDIDHSTIVLGNDITAVRNAQLDVAGFGGFRLQRDIDGSGVVLGNDIIAVRNRQLTFLPAGSPVNPLAPIASAPAPAAPEASTDGGDVDLLSLATPRPAVRQIVPTTDILRPRPALFALPTFDRGLRLLDLLDDPDDPDGDVSIL